MTAALAIGAAALALSLRGVNLVDMVGAMWRQPPGRLAAALALTVASFACLAVYDVVNTHVVARGRVPARLAALAGAASAAIANTIGFHAVSATAVRAHLYLRAGLSGAELARVASLSGLSLVAGNAAMLAVAELFEGADAGRAMERHAWLHLAFGTAMLLAMAAWLVWLARARDARVIAVGRFRFPMPSAPLAAVLMAIGAIESGTAIGALYVLLPADLRPPFAAFAIGCLAAVALGVVAHTPGGIGVFEASMIALLGGRGRSDLLAALLLYRLVYNLLPCLIAVMVLGLRAWRQRSSTSPST